MDRPEPLWKTPSRAQAREMLLYSRARVEDLVAGLSDKQLTRQTQLGGGTWSIKDLMGHLAGYEEQACDIASGREPRFEFAGYASVDERNAADLERKKGWTLSRVRKDLHDRRSELLRVIAEMSDERWTSKIETGSGRRSALALVLGRLLVGGRYGLFAHDLAHVTDLQRSVKMLTTPDG